MDNKNPFEFDAAPNLDPKELITWYIEDHNYSRFFQSTRNIIVNGERGSGKSMTLIYNSLKYKIRRSELPNNAIPIPGEYIGIYVPCNTPLSAKEEYKLFNEIQGLQLSETNLTFSIITNVAGELDAIDEFLSQDDRDMLIDEFSFYLELSSEISKVESRPFKLLRREVHRRIKMQQKEIVENQLNRDVSVNNFFTLVLPILKSIKQAVLLKNSHISLLIDDIQDLNVHQQKIVNSWIGYRDHSIFSIKASVAGLRNYNLSTSYDGVLLEGHDYITVDLQRPFQNKDSEYGHFARDVVRKRLSLVGIKSKPEDYFPVHPTWVKGLETSAKKAQEEAVARGYNKGSKPYNDYVYKMRRAFYFRHREATANKPVYSGFETLNHLSTGVIRNLLQPCFFMWEQQTAALSGKKPEIIPSDIQNNVIIEQSDKLWDFISDNLERRIPGCTEDDAIKIKNLFQKLAEYFRNRLLYHSSEPRVVTFIVSEKDHNTWRSLSHLLEIAERAQLIYVRDGTSKKGGGRETYYVPNRLLWPRYGLDAHGQHGRASIRSRDLWAAAANNRSIDFERNENTVEQGMLFNDV